MSDSITPRLRNRPRLALLVALALGTSGVIAGCGGFESGAHLRPPTVAAASTPPSALSAPSTVDLGAHPSVSEARAEVTIGARAGLARVPRSYFGISTEYWALPLFGQNMPMLERVLSLLHVRDNGPLVLRIGGDSADHTFWNPHPQRPPRWAFQLTPRWLDRVRELVRRLGVRLIIDLNLITDAPATAARWARAAVTGLPHGSILAFEVGNEPDIYRRSDWLRLTSHTALGRLLPTVLTSSDYSANFRAYAEALQGAPSRVPLAGPALANPHLNAPWISTLIGSDRRGLGFITVHRYPYSACAARGWRGYPTIARLLSSRASLGMARSLRPAVALAHSAGLPIRLTELNSVTCGGRAHVSNTFATALWAPDALFNLLRTGIDAVNLHVRARAINAPFEITRAGLVARPLLYGLILFARTLGPRPRLVSLHMRAPASPKLSTWAVRVGRDTLHALLINKGRRPLAVQLRLPARGAATVQRLLAPSAGAESGVTLNGQQLGSDGRWQGWPTGFTLAGSADGYRLSVPGLSAALLSMHVRPGSLGVTR